MVDDVDLAERQLQRLTHKVSAARFWAITSRRPSIAAGIEALLGVAVRRLEITPETSAPDDRGVSAQS